VHGKAGWGFKVVGPKDNKRFEPTAEGRRWIPWIYEQVILAEYDGTRIMAGEAILNEDDGSVLAIDRWT
jgi:hypothetical protein